MRIALCSAALAIAVAATPAFARDVSLPETGAVLSVEIPNDWALEISEAGLEAVAPEANSFVIAKILSRPKDDPNKWLAEALDKMKARGVRFGGPARTVAQSPKPADPDVKAAQIAAGETKSPAFAPPPADKPAGPPSLGMPIGAAPFQVPGAAQVPPAGAKTPLAAAPAPSPAPSAPAPVAHPFPRHALPYKDTSVDGKPVDVELMTYNLPDKSIFFLLQESGPTDDRVVGIINSVKPVK